MKTATITFHWATNYGAVLQSYSLQQFLMKNNYETEIINYIPQNRARRLNRFQKNNDELSFTKEENLESFRKEHLLLSSNVYANSRQLHKSQMKYDYVITGSDQVWNQSFVCYAEGHFHLKPVLSYYLDFLSDDVGRIAYAVSFGTEQLKSKVEKSIIPELRKFKKIGVRENTGKDILDRIGIISNVVLDPVFLLDKCDYLSLINNTETKTITDCVFSYILHNDSLSEQITKYISEKMNCDIQYDDGCIMEQWLNYIFSSSFVVTNSFHGLALSIIFHKPFIVNIVQGSGMNDRIFSLLERIDLSDRIITDFSKDKIDEILYKTIDWEKIDSKIAELQSFSRNFILSAIK